VFDLATIKDMNRKAGNIARQKGMLPLVLTQAMIDQFRKNPYAAGFQFPHLGDRRPRTWPLVDTIFCDTGGFGGPGEPALTIHQLGTRLKAGMAYATVKIGQFQVHLGEFLPRDPR
jgi:hypothetical protein